MRVAADRHDCRLDLFGFMGLEGGEKGRGRAAASAIFECNIKDVIMQCLGGERAYARKTGMSRDPFWASARNALRETWAGQSRGTHRSLLVQPWV